MKLEVITLVVVEVVKAGGVIIVVVVIDGSGDIFVTAAVQAPEVCVD